MLLQAYREGLECRSILPLKKCIPPGLEGSDLAACRSTKVTGSQTLKLVHDRYKGKAPTEILQEFARQMETAAKGNRELAQHVGKAMEDLSALRVGAVVMVVRFFPAIGLFFARKVVCLPILCIVDCSDSRFMAQANINRVFGP